jgi:hypothetical protein
MARQLQISVDGDGGVSLDMPATLEDEEVALLDLYLENLERLMALKVAREGVPCSFEINVRDSRVHSIRSEIPPDDEVATLLHRLRPFILANEAASYVNVTALLARRFNYSYLRQVLKQQRRLFDGRNNQDLMKITSNGTVINSEQTLFDWLNGYEYHGDRKKRDKIESLHRLMPLEHSIPILMGLLGDKVQAIRQLAGLIAVILGREQSLRIVRHGPPLHRLLQTQTA